MFKKKDIGFGKVFYSDLIPDLEHFFTTRETDIDNHREEILAYLGLDEGALVNPRQTHSCNIEFVTCGKKEYPQTDALILTDYNQAVYLRFADCTPIILYDKRANIASVVHAGWRGTVQKIVDGTVKKMLDFSKSSLSDVFVAIGPAISGCCYSVGDEVVDAVNNSASYSTDLIIQKDNKSYVDLKSVNERQLVELGVPKENIDVCNFCTSCNNDLFYSYRKENGTENRHNAVIKLKKRAV